MPNTRTGPNEGGKTNGLGGFFSLYYMNNKGRVELFSEINKAGSPNISMYFVNNFVPNLTLCGGPTSFRLIQINIKSRFVGMYVTLDGHKRTTFDHI